MPKLPTFIDRTALSPLFDHSVGYDRLFDLLLDDFMPAISNNNFPPYNIIKVGENSRMIEIALAGYSEKDIDVTVEEGILIIKGNKTDESDNGYLHKGVASRKFTRQFKLAENAEVKSANLTNGLLQIMIEINEPEKFVQKIEVTSNNKTLEDQRPL